MRVNACTMLLPDILDEIDRIAINSRRSRSQVIEMLVARGFTRYKADGRLEDSERAEPADYKPIGAASHIEEARRLATSGDKDNR